MGDILWPNDLRNAGSLGFSGGPQSNLSVFEPSQGKPSTMRRATSVVRMYDVELKHITRAQRESFLRFFHIDLKDGSLPFLWVDPMQGAIPSFAVPYVVDDLTPAIMLDFVAELYAADDFNGTERYQKMQIMPKSGDKAYSETRVTPESFTITFSVVLVK